MAPGRLKRREDSKTILETQSTAELVFAVVGHIGSGASQIGTALKAALEARGFEVHILKAREQILAWAERNSKPSPGPEGTVAHVRSLQDWGDEMRQSDHTAVAVGLVHAIRKARAGSTATEMKPGAAVIPDEKQRAYILDSIRHPAEADLLREVYRAAFILVGVVCSEEARLSRLMAKFKDAGNDVAEELMLRDADASGQPWGQHVEDAFHTSDVFLDNSAPRFTDKAKKMVNKAWTVPDQLSRLVKIILGAGVVRPTIHEAAMYAAYGAKMSSACLSKQVGAALVDADRNIVSTGTNEVPRAGGGVFAGALEGELDYRCAHADGAFCSNTKEQRENIKLVLDAIPESAGWTPEQRADIERKLRKSPLGQALEFSRAVHAEMDAILTAARSGAPIVGSTLYTTTYPCHYCARHLVAAGVYEIQYVEPYPKSKALKLHPDTITVTAEDWIPPSQPGGKVLIRPFTGVAPRLYRRAFLKTTDLKDESGRLQIGSTPWGNPWQLRKASYPQLEADLARSVEQSSD